MNLVLGTLQVSSCIPVSAEEVISYILHKNPHRQLDQESDQESAVADYSKGSAGARRGGRDPDKGGLQRDFSGEGRARRRSSTSPKRLAERAAMRSLRGHRQYIIMDCRPREEFEAFRLAPALHLDPDLLVTPDDLDAKLKEFMPLQVRLLVQVDREDGSNWVREGMTKHAEGRIGSRRRVDLRWRLLLMLPAIISLLSVGLDYGYDPDLTLIGIGEMLHSQPSARILEDQNRGQCVALRSMLIPSAMVWVAL